MITGRAKRITVGPLDASDNASFEIVLCGRASMTKMLEILASFENKVECGVKESSTNERGYFFGITDNSVESVTDN